MGTFHTSCSVEELLNVTVMRRNVLRVFSAVDIWSSPTAVLYP
jgi:hypothetical protein